MFAQGEMCVFVLFQSNFSILTNGNPFRSHVIAMFPPPFPLLVEQGGTSSLAVVALEASATELNGGLQ